MKTKKENKIKSQFKNTVFNDGYFKIPDGYTKIRLPDSSADITQTATLSSANVIIRSDGYVVGAVQRFDFWELNNQGVLSVYGQCTRVCFNKMNILEAFTGQPHIDPVKKFDIEIFYQYPGETTTWDGYGIMQCSGPCVVLGGVEITNRHTYFDVDKFVVMEDICFSAEKIFTKNKKQAEKISLSHFKPE